MSVNVILDKPLQPSFLEVKTKFSGIFSWIFSTDHKRIGILYLTSVISFFLVGVTLGFLMRFEQLTIGPTIMQPQTYNAIFTLHGVIMIFLFIIPGIPAIFGNFFLPIQIGAKDVGSTPQTIRSIKSPTGISKSGTDK